jgi:molybdopterin-guanine dinucleotide biosynthesis protein A
LGGIYTALATSEADRVLVVACDLPSLDAGVLHRLVELADDADGAWIESGRGVEPLLACYRTSAAPRVREAIDAGRLKAAALGEVLRMASLNVAELARFGDVERLLANLNTPDDLARYNNAGR